MTELGLFKYLRKQRGFKTKEYAKAKVKAINDFFREEGLDAAVVGISGGVDSAVVLKLLERAANQKGSPIKAIKAAFVSIPRDGTTGQLEAWKRAKLLGLTDKNHFYNADAAFDAIVWDVKNFDASAWARGQMASVLRTPYFYFLAAILQTHGYKSIVVGTINKSEGSYIGYFGKYSDGAVDAQIIGDIYKHEVYKVANYLGVPDRIIDSTPKGDVYNGATDEEMIGVSYDFLDFYLLLKEFNFKIKKSGIGAERFAEFSRKARVIENLNKANKHKYKHGASLAAFIDVMPRKIKGGWE